MKRLLSRLVLVWLVVLQVASVYADKWTTLKDCKLVRSEYGDGDSFHVYAAGTDYIIRLYFVDCAETNDSYPDRVETQGAYWKIDTKKTLELGKKAEEFTNRKLSKPFTVITQFLNARGASNQPRYYGFVYPENGKEILQEQLVANGLARVFGMNTRLPDGRDVDAFHQQLTRLEDKAKSQHLGGWGGKEAVEVKAPTNDDFFNRARALSKATPLPTPAPTPTPATVTATPQVPAKTTGPRLSPNGSSLVNINTASAEEINTLPKIGDVLTQRIIAGRPYKTVSDLMMVKGMKSSIMDAITPRVTVDGN
ncbi:MAG: helix-hairpin-helix domain-containing protein [Chthoniobacterales bacterium]